MSGTPESVMNEALLYIRIYFIGIPFMMIYNFGSAVLRSFGDTRRPMSVLSDLIGNCQCNIESDLSHLFQTRGGRGRHCHGNIQYPECGTGIDLFILQRG